MTPLRQRMTEAMQIRNFTHNTQAAYLQQIAALARYYHQSPEALAAEQVQAYQLYLTNERKLAPGSLCTVAAALRFLYHVTLKREWALNDIPIPKKPLKLPVILSREEINRFLECIGSLKHRTLLTTAYAAGLRVSEATHLKLTDIDSQRMVIRVEQGKGQKDRYVMLSPRLLEVLRAYWKLARPSEWLFPGGLLAARSPEMRWGRRATKRGAYRASTSRSPRIRCGTPSPPICWKAAPTCARSSCCLATAASPPPRTTSR